MLFLSRPQSSFEVLYRPDFPFFLVERGEDGREGTIDYTSKDSKIGGDNCAPCTPFLASICANDKYSKMPPNIPPSITFPLMSGLHALRHYYFR